MANIDGHTKLKRDYCISLRFPGVIADEIKLRARDDWRTFNAQTILMLRDYIKKPKIEQLLENIQERLTAIESKLPKK